MSWWLVALVIVAALVVSTAGGWALTTAVLGLAARSSDAGSPEAVAQGDPGEPGEPARVDDGPTGQRARAALRGGTWIGILERLAVTGTLLAGYPSGVAIVVAVKGLGRYPELRDHPGSSERFVIGTLASLVWAALVGGAARALIGA